MNYLLSLLCFIVAAHLADASFQYFGDNEHRSGVLNAYLSFIAILLGIAFVLKWT